MMPLLKMIFFIFFFRYHVTDSDVKGFVEPLGLTDKDLVFLAVNDQQSADETGGTHW